MFEQLLKVNVQINEAAGWCLQYARRTFGLPAVEPTAWAAWEATRYKHRDRNFPKGVSVPVWFDWWGDVGSGRYRYGHVAVLHTDGKVWSSPLSGNGRAWFNSVDDLCRAFGNGMTYVGWSEDISGSRVVKAREVEVKIGTTSNWKARFNKLHRQLVRNGNMSEAVWNGIKGKDAWGVVERWSDHKEAAQLIKWQELGQKADKDDWAGQIRRANAKIAALEKAGAVELVEVTEKLYKKK